jgi:hypothetical protein
LVSLCCGFVGSILGGFLFLSSLLEGLDVF